MTRIENQIFYIDLGEIPGTKPNMKFFKAFHKAIFFLILFGAQTSASLPSEDLNELIRSSDQALRLNLQFEDYELPLLIEACDHLYHSGLEKNTPCFGPTLRKKGIT